MRKKSNYIFYGRYKPGGKKWIVSSPFNDATAIDVAFRHIEKRYKIELEAGRKRALEALKLLYGKVGFYIPDSIVTQVNIAVKEMMTICMKSVKNILPHIRKYVGYDCELCRYVKGQKTIVSLDRIKKALLGIRDGLSFTKIENLLYF